MASDDRLLALRKRLRSAARAAGDTGGEVSVAADELLTILDALGRVTQSADRLRRQNRRLRLRCQRLGGDVDPEEDA